jgi:hypothetical protein
MYKNEKKQNPVKTKNAKIYFGTEGQLQKDIVKSTSLYMEMTFSAISF